MRISSLLRSGGRGRQSFPRLTHHHNRGVHTLVLLRHGESEFNQEHRFTGWADVALTDKGKADAAEAGELLRLRGFEFDRVFTSSLTRAQETAETCVAQMLANPKASSSSSSPSSAAAAPGIECHWQLNERHYGALQRLRKDDPRLLDEHGSAQVLEWRRSYDIPPPPLCDEDHPDYAVSAAHDVFSESLHDCHERVSAAWGGLVAPAVARGERVLVVAHANTIRALIMTIDGVTAEDIRKVKVPNAVPLVYHLAETEEEAAQSGGSGGSGGLVPVDPEDELHFHGEYLACTSNHERVASCYEAHNSALRELWAALLADPEHKLTDDEGRLCLKELTKRAGGMVYWGDGEHFDVCQMLTSLWLMRETVQSTRRQGARNGGRHSGDDADDDRISYAEFVLAFSAPQARFSFSGKKKRFGWLQ